MNAALEHCELGGIDKCGMLLTHECFAHQSDEWKENCIRELRVMEDVDGWVEGYNDYLEGLIAKYDEATKEQWRDKTPDEYASDLRPLFQKLWDTPEEDGEPPFMAARLLVVVFMQIGNILKGFRENADHWLRPAFLRDSVEPWEMMRRLMQEGKRDLTENECDLLFGWEHECAKHRRMLRLKTEPMWQQKLLKETAQYYQIAGQFVQDQIVKDAAKICGRTEKFVRDYLEKISPCPKTGELSPQHQGDGATGSASSSHLDAAQAALLARVLALPHEIEDAEACGVTADDFTEPYRTLWEIAVRGHSFADPRIPERYTKLAAQLEHEPPVGAQYPAPELARKLRAQNANEARRAAVTAALRTS